MFCSNVRTAVFYHPPEGFSLGYDEGGLGPLPDVALDVPLRGGRVQAVGERVPEHGLTQAVWLGVRLCPKGLESNCIVPPSTL